MTVTISINGLSLIHQGSGGVATATLPNVCKKQVGNAVLPVPLPNVAESKNLQNGTQSIEVDGGHSAAIHLPHQELVYWLFLAPINLMKSAFKAAFIDFAGGWLYTFFNWRGRVFTGCCNGDGDCPSSLRCTGTSASDRRYCVLDL